MDWGSLAGVALALTAVLVAHLLDGGHIGSLVQPAAFVVVVIGTIGAVLLQNRMPVFVRGVRMARWVFAPPPDNRQTMANEISSWSHTARREGLLSLEPFMQATRDPFIAKGLRLIIDGTEPGKLREILDLEIGAYEMEQRQAAKIWEAAGGYSPTIGILGAVLGLIHVMENLSDPTKLGGGIAVAFVATIYGVGLANLVFLPIGNRLKATVMHEVNKREMLADAFLGIATGDNPRAIEERVAVYLR
ncbi:flagellar motor protein [Sulfuriferula plumbiphila]|uniref:Flagellar motor protein n=1 Tax=Sulfuriferula plumbiphila TaxID=171865 RepID=A0A512L4F0_9PROT|nr:flagellar motor protein [Sulfuriferula plumbiphila]BBP03816.1 flagellar motor protein [Sulfuriferula plumbiphila]GEP29355.1 flagellar motor protein [Sulfuriferula plumbiphila]